MHRSFALVIVLVALAAGGLASVGAQEATPGADLAALGYPELRIRANDQGLQGPAQVPAGRYLMTLENDGAGEHGAAIMHTPHGMTLADLRAQIDAVLAATPAAGSPSADDEGGPPLFLN